MRCTTAFLTRACTHAPQFPKRYVMDTPQMPDEPQHATGCAPEPAPSVHV